MNNICNNRIPRIITIPEIIAPFGAKKKSTPPIIRENTIYEWEGVSLVQVYKRAGKSVISVGKKELIDAFHGCEKD